MQKNSINNSRTIKKFTNKCLDKRRSSYKSLKTADSFCREAIEKILDENADIKNLLSQSNEQCLWMKELIVNYTLLKMHHHAILWEIDDHEPKF